MKRSRSEVPLSTTTITKSQKRSKGNNSPTISQMQKPSRLKKSPRSDIIHKNDDQLQEKVAEAVLSQAAKEDLEIVWDEMMSLEWGYWWPFEELLLGWFPFEDTDFFFTDNYNVRSNGVNWDEYHDIWHLKQIHEVPTSSNS